MNTSTHSKLGTISKERKTTITSALDAIINQESQCLINYKLKMQSFKESFRAEAVSLQNKINESQSIINELEIKIKEKDDIISSKESYIAKLEVQVKELEAIQSNEALPSSAEIAPSINEPESSGATPDHRDHSDKITLEKRKPKLHSFKHKPMMIDIKSTNES